MNVSYFIKKHSPTILSALGAAGVVGTAVSSVIAYKRFDEEIENQNGDLSVKDKLLIAAPYAALPAGLCIGTISCIFGANSINKKRQASMASAYALLSTAFQRIERDGLDYMEGKIPIEMFENHDETGEMLYFDEFSGSYFEMRPEDFEKVKNTLNEMLASYDHVPIEEYYKMLKIHISDSQAIQSLGWDASNLYAQYGKIWIEFDEEDVLIEDDLECRVVSIVTQPELGVFY